MSFLNVSGQTELTSPGNVLKYSPDQDRDEAGRFGSGGGGGSAPGGGGHEQAKPNIDARASKLPDSTAKTEKKIISADGRYVILTTRDQEYRFNGKINHIGSTEAQPYIAANFTADGVIVGGRTLQESAAKLILNTASAKGWVIEEKTHE